MRYPIWRDIKISGNTEGVFYLKKNGQEVSDIGLFIRPDQDHYELFINKLCEVLLDNNIDLENEGVYVCPEAVGTFSVEDISGNTLGSVDFRWDWSYEDLSDVRQLSFPINGHADPRMNMLYSQINEDSSYSNVIINTDDSDFKYVSIFPPKIIIPITGGTFEINISTNVSWNASYPEWVTPIGSTSGTSGDSVFQFSVEYNSGETVFTDISFIGESGVTTNCHLERVGGSGSTVLLYRSTSGQTITPYGGNNWHDANIVYNGVWSADTTWNAIVLDRYVDYIPSSTFRNKTGLTEVLIPEYFINLGDSAWETDPEGNIFCGCSNLISANIPTGVTRIDSANFSGCTSLSSITIPSGVEYIGNYAFCGCGKINVSIPQGVTYIGEGAFIGCSSIEEITIPDNLRNIEMWTFSGCTGLTTLTVGRNVLFILDSAFRGCSSLSTIISYAGDSQNPPMAPDGGWYVFDGISPTGTLYYPAGYDYNYSCWMIASPYASPPLNCLPPAWTKEEFNI